MNCCGGGTFPTPTRPSVTVTHLLCVPVAVTKPVIVAGERGLTVPAGARTSLSCVASGSPPISYRWFRSSPGGKARLLGHQAELVWDSAQPSDSGTYHCEAQGRAGAARQSDAVQLTVTGESWHWGWHPPFFTVCLIRAEGQENVPCVPLGPGLCRMGACLLPWHILLLFGWHWRQREEEMT